MMYPFDTPKEKRVVIYARVSTEHEAQVYALGNQLEWYNAFLERHPEWILVDKYIDEGITGTSAEKRPGFTQMISDAHEHKFDLIITREVSRFARNTEETLHFTKALRRVGVEVFFINDGIKTFDGDGELRLSLMASLAQEESRKTSIRVKSGQQVSMNNGVFYGNGNILGYDRVGKDLVINPEQAETVRMIYDMYLAGDGLMKIKDELERRGRLTSMGKTRWHCTVISHVLQNTFYCGIITYHKEYVENYLDQKKTKNYGEIELTQVEFQIMELFIKNADTAMKRSAILKAVWDDRFKGQEKIVDVNIRRIRMKIEDEPSEPQYIQTVWGFGYKWPKM